MILFRYVFITPILFFQYFCGICKLFDNTDKQQFHCDGCRLCRVGGKENYYHCETCQMCLAISVKDSHKVSPLSIL